MKSRIPIIAIVGRPNVGKSSLFNRLVGYRVAVVREESGVTRDRNYCEVTRHGFNFSLVDTGGISTAAGEDLELAVREQAEIAIAESDLIIAVFDGLAGPLPGDEEVVKFLRRSSKPVIWVVNKCEKESTESESQEFYALGVDDLTFVSAAHGKGVPDLIEEIRVQLSKLKLVTDWRAELNTQEIKVSFLGRPNVGKSSLINKIVGNDRLVTSEIAGTTRDSIDVMVRRSGQDFRIVDTAGLRRKARVSNQSSERYGNLRTLKALVRGDVIVLVLDLSSELPTEQDNKIAALVEERGKGLVVVVNKWDLVEKDERSVAEYEQLVKKIIPTSSYAPILFVSAKSGKRCPQILDAVSEVYASAHKRLPTPKVNELLRSIFEKHPPPAYRGAPVKLLYAAQVGIAPPTFTLFVNHPRKISQSYRKYILNALREHEPFLGSKIELQVKKRGIQKSE